MPQRQRMRDRFAPPVPMPRERPASTTAPSNSAVAEQVPAPTPAPQPATPTLAAATEPAPQATPFVRMTDRAKMDYMATLMQGSRGMLDANDVSSHLETQMASAIPHEINFNERRNGVGRHFAREAGSLKTQIAGVDLTDAAAVAKLEKGMGSDRKALLDQVRSGALDLSALSGKDKDADKAVREQITGIGVDHRTSQYGEMTALLDRQRGGEKLGKADQARLTELKGVTRGIGMTGSLGDVWGLSPERFREIYEPGNTRFEERQYIQLRDSYDRNKKTHDAAAAAAEKDPKKSPPSPEVLAKAGIGAFEISEKGQATMGTHHDLLADIATSYGGSQIMGGYAQSEHWRGQNPGERLQPVKDAQGKEHTATIDELKRAGRRQDPTTEDVSLMLSELKMKGVKPDTTSLTNDQFIRKYNGSRPGSDLYDGYMSAMTQNAPMYTAAKNKLPKPPG